MTGGGLDLRLTGGAQLLDLGKVLKETANKGLAKQMDRGLRAAAKPVTAAVKAEATETMPKSGGYNVLLAASVRGRVQSRRSRFAASVTLFVTAQGKAENRDLPRINQGRLRHPVFGRYRRVRGRKVESPWVSQTVRRGVADRPFKDAAPDVQKQMLKVLDDVAAALAAGKVPQ